jgi:hypothetical protein
LSICRRALSQRKRMAPAPSGLFALGIGSQGVGGLGRAMIQRKAGPPRIDRPARRGRPVYERFAHIGGQGTGQRDAAAVKRHRPGGVRGLSGHGFAGRSFVRRPHQLHPRKKALRKTHARGAACVGEAGTFIADSVNGNKGERKRGLRPHNAYATRSPTRPLQAHQVRSRLLRPTPGCGAKGQGGRSSGAFAVRANGSFKGEQCRRNQRQVLQTSPSRGRLWLFPAVCASSPG